MRRGTRSKYGNQQYDLDGYSFHSKLEAAVYQLLKLRMKAKEIKSIACQQTVYLTRARIIYKPDFRCVLSNGNDLYVEAKGFEAPRWPTIKKLWEYYGPGPLELWKGSYGNPKLIETIIPIIL